jgi:hypothetical protein
MGFSPAFGFRQAKTGKDTNEDQDFTNPKVGSFQALRCFLAVSPALSNPLAAKLLESYMMLHVYLYLQYL